MGNRKHEKGRERYDRPKGQPRISRSNPYSRKDRRALASVKERNFYQMDDDDEQ